MPGILPRAAAFLVLFAALQVAWQAAADGAAGRWIVERGIVAPAAALVATLSPELRACAQGRTLYGGGAGLHVVNGCDGVESGLMLAAAFAVAPLPWRRRGRALLLGLPLAYALNEARIIGLFYARLHDAVLFELGHALAAPLLMVLALLAYYRACLDRHERRAG